MTQPFLVNGTVPGTEYTLKALAFARLRNFRTKPQHLRAHLEKVAPLTDEQFALRLSQFTRQRFCKYHYLIWEGERVEQAYLVVTGLLKPVYHNAAGKAHIVSLAREH